MRAAIAIMVLLLCATAFAQEHKVGVLHYVDPIFPPIARQARIHGDVVVELKLGEAGFVQGMTILSGHPMLNQATLAALQKWQFICLDCKHYPEPITHRFTITYLANEALSCAPPLTLKVTPDFTNNRMIVEPPPMCIESDPDGSSVQEHKVGVNRYEAPKYPLIAFQARIQGDVVLDLKLDGNGEVVAIDAVNGHPMLKAAAIAAIKRWRFVCIDCRWNERFNHRFTVAFRIGDGDCNLRITRSLIDFPNKITVEQGSGCVETTVSQSKADLH